MQMRHLFESHLLMKTDAVMCKILVFIFRVCNARIHILYTLHPQSLLKSLI